MKCPKCETPGMKLQPGTKKYYYCSGCNYAFSVDEKYNAKEFELNFEGLAPVKSILDFIAGVAELNPVTRSIIETQMTAALFEQWFEGMKAGQLASIVYAKEFYNDGKNRDESRREVGESTDGADVGEAKALSVDGEVRETRDGSESAGDVLRAEKDGDRGRAGEDGIPREVETIVNGVPVRYPFDIARDEDDMLMEVAKIIDSCSLDIKSIRVVDGSISLRLK